MNITDILKTLCEAAEVNKIKTSVGDKVPASVMDALTKNAKETQRGKFFDNEAMAIINSISRGNDDPFLLSSPNAVHSILKKLKRGNSSFKADEILSGGKGKSYWKELYKKSNEGKPELTKAEKDYNETGLKTAIVKSIDDEWFAILPKNFYDTENAEKELKQVDIEKSHEDIRRISAEIAAKDSGKDKNKTAPVWGENPKEHESPNVNHWCVSSSGSNYYRSYAKGNVFKFVIFVKKNPDGSPNWDKRYLWFYGDRGKPEFADKWDKHVMQQRVLSKKAQTFVKKIMRSITETDKKRRDFISNIEQTAQNKAKEDKRLSKEYDIEVDDEIEKMLIGAKRRDITPKEEVEIITKTMPWLEEASKLKAAEIKRYFVEKATNAFSFVDCYWYTSDNYKSGVAISMKPNAFETSGCQVMIFNGDSETTINKLWNFSANFVQTAKQTDSVLYFGKDVTTFKRVLSLLRTIVGAEKAKYGSSRASGYGLYGLKKLAAFHVSEALPTEKTVMKNLSKIGQEIFDRAYNSVVPQKTITQTSGKSFYTRKTFYNSELGISFEIIFNYSPNAKRYEVWYATPENHWELLTVINNSNDLSKAKETIKKFLDKRRAELKEKQAEESK